MVHLSNSRGQKTSKSTSQCRGAEEERVPFLGLLATVVHANQVEAAREHASLKNTEEETNSKQTAVVLDETLHGGGEAEEKHVDRKPNMRLEFLEQHITRDFEQNVWHEEDDQSGVVLQASSVVQAEFCGKTVDICITNVDTI